MQELFCSGPLEAQSWNFPKNEITSLKPVGKHVFLEMKIKEHFWGKCWTSINISAYIMCLFIHHF